MASSRMTKSKAATPSFWRTLPTPFFVLAPMANVTDVAFRSIIATYGKPDVMWNEFVSADGLCSAGRGRLFVDLTFSKKEKPIVAQLFTGDPEPMRKAAALCAELGYDGLDINMGCPDRAVEKQGGGAASMKNPKNALEVLEAARTGFGRADAVSVKTRIGYNRVEMDWLRLLLEQKLPALTVHLRTRKEMSDVSAHWELMPEIVKLRDLVQTDLPLSERTRIIGNGDVESIADGVAKMKKSGCDGVMIGRGIFGTPWFFENCRTGKDARSRTPEERLSIMVEHAKLFEKTFCGKNGAKRFKNFAVMKKHFKAYVSGWDGAKELRVELMETENASEVSDIVKAYIKR